MRQSNSRSRNALLIELRGKARLEQQLTVTFLNPAAAVRYCKDRPLPILIHFKGHAAFNLYHFNRICRKITE
ncbi:hypothetical protein D3C87_2011860 [compost metagenome]